jgi:hypothetical protein
MACLPLTRAAERATWNASAAAARGSFQGLTLLLRCCCRFGSCPLPLLLLLGATNRREREASRLYPWQCALLSLRAGTPWTARALLLVGL